MDDDVDGDLPPAGDDDLGPYDDVTAGEVVFSDDEGSTFYSPTTVYFFEPVEIAGEVPPGTAGEPTAAQSDVSDVSASEQGDPWPDFGYDLLTSSPYDSVVAHDQRDPQFSPNESLLPLTDARSSAYSKAVQRARAPFSPRLAPRLTLPAGGVGATATGTVGAVGVGALAAGAFLSVLGGLAYTASRTGDTFEQRVRRRVIGQGMLEDGLINQEEFDEFVRSGNLPAEVTERAARWFLYRQGDIDLWGAKGAGRTATGQPRDYRLFWRLYIAQKSGLGLSAKNLAEISAGRSPRVDREWVKAYPRHHGFEGRKLVHHHIEGTSVATPIPDTVHWRFFEALHGYLGMIQAQ